EHVQDGFRVVAERSRELDRALHRPALNEDAEPVQESPLLTGEQGVAPVEHGEQIAVARIASGRIAAQKAEPVIEALQDLLCREQRKARRGELQRERHAVEATADLGKGRRVRGVESEMRLYRADPGEQHPDGWSTLDVAQ